MARGYAARQDHGWDGTLIRLLFTSRSRILLSHTCDECSTTHHLQGRRGRWGNSQPSPYLSPPHPYRSLHNERS
ncbi:hypothetical protein PsYK624_014090 [Phanerochaete sordida]|uniref:Uncharacterized protein n=1 Tax=Phanerochaete sordida TaxID=48140 RepID=A0A9P3L7T6_9APHY|nr:hypothetical protein PsYK624_014090 [Phanerochaete sordida]